MGLSLYETFNDVKETRQPGGLRHPLQSFLTMTTLGIMSGNHAYQELATFFKANKEEFVELFGLQHGVPGYTQIRTILRGIDYPSLYQAFQDWAMQYIPLEMEEWISGDGKSLKSTVADCHTSKQNFVAMLSFFAQETGTVLAVGRYENGRTGESPTLRQTLESLELKGFIITGDAVHCQKKQ